MMAKISDSGYNSPTQVTEAEKILQDVLTTVGRIEIFSSVAEKLNSVSEDDPILFIHWIGQNQYVAHINANPPLLHAVAVDIGMPQAPGGYNTEEFRHRIIQRCTDGLEIENVGDCDAVLQCKSMAKFCDMLGNIHAFAVKPWCGHLAAFNGRLAVLFCVSGTVRAEELGPFPIQHTVW